MTTRPFRGALFLIGVLLPAMIALGDGGMFFPWAPHRRAEVFQPTQKVYIQWNGSEERLLIQTRYEGPAEEMVWIVPVPAQPTVARGDAAVFQQLAVETAAPDLSFTEFAGLEFHGATAGGSSGDGTSPLAWRRRVGDYDVALLRPTESESVLHWLNANGYAVPDEIAPVLEDYVREEWWMVASRIHPEALTEITQDKLANGTLHPLELVFESPACVYPLRLTSMAAGPVEELIYIEGPTHYEPVTSAEGDWDIRLVGGPIRQVRNAAYLSDVEYVTEIVEGRATTVPMRCLTRLHRVFQPEEMVDDLVFAELDYAKWMADDDPLRLAQAATQYGRRRDPNGVPYLLAALSPEALDDANPAPEDYLESLPLSARLFSSRGLNMWLYFWREPSSWNDYEGDAIMGCTHRRCCIWALGEIGLEHGADELIEETLARCAEHDNQVLRMEAYLALMRLRSERLGPILSERIADALDGPPPSGILWYPDLQAAYGEMEIVTDWIGRFGTTQVKDELVAGLARQIDETPDEALLYVWNIPERSWSTPYSWTEWILWRAACTQDARLLTPLRNRYARITNEADPALWVIPRAEAACGSADASAALLAQIIDEEAAVLEQGQVEETGGIASLRRFYWYNSRYPPSLRVQIIRKRRARYQLHPMPEAAADAVIRATLSEEGLSDWYTLYLLACIREPLAQDQERLLEIWNKGDETVTLVAADVLYAWGDAQILMDWYDKTDLPDIRAEIAWALAELEATQATDIIEEQVRESWNSLWTSFKQPFFLRAISHGRPVSPEDPPLIDATRKAETLWRYLHPEIGTLDEERLALLQRLAADTSIAPGVRVEWLASDYGVPDWALPLLRAATMELLQANQQPETVVRLVSYVGSAFVVDVVGEAPSDEFRRTLLNNLLTAMYGRNQTVVQGLLWDTWPQRYTETNGTSLLFSAPGNPDIDGYCQRDQFGATLADALERMVQDDALPAGYRAFLLIHWRGATERISAAIVESLLQQDMPAFLHEALAQRLLAWP